jgi:hypothetical protein
MNHLKKVTLIVTLMLGLTACAPGAIDFESLAERQLRAIEPCIGRVFTRGFDLNEFKNCAVDSLQDELSFEVARLIDSYASQVDSRLQRALLAFFNVHTTKELGSEIVRLVNEAFFEQTRPLSLGDAFYP